MQKQNPKVVLTSTTKSKLQSLKKQPSETYDQVINRAIYSSISPQQQTSKVIGAGTGLDAYANYEHQLGWIVDTSEKLIASGLDHSITPSMREQAYDIEPLVSGIICPFLKNVILADYSIETKDNKKFAAFIEEAEAFIEEIKLMTIYRDDFEDLAIKHGASYRRKDYKNPTTRDYLKKLQRLECRAMKTYEDPFDSDIVLYHQNIYASDIFSSTITSSNSAINSWWIPDGLTINVDDGVYSDGAEELFEYYQNKYGINETNRLRVGDSKDIIAMHFRRPGKPAPIDAIIQAIWEKRAVTANLPNLIFSVLYPFIQIIHGTMIEKVDANGNKYLATSVPQPASSSDPEINAQQAAIYSAFQAAMKKNSEDIIKYRHEGGSASTGPDIAIKILESASSIAPGFITAIFKHFNDEIGQGLGFPMSLVMASGNELATSRTIKEMFNTVYAGMTHDYEHNADELIRERFAGRSWNYELTQKDGTVDEGKYTFEDIGAEFLLSTGDITDNLKKAQTMLLYFQSWQAAKVLGATKADIQAAMAEEGYEGWDMLNFDLAPNGQPMFGTPGIMGTDASGNGQTIEQQLGLSSPIQPEVMLNGAQITAAIDVLRAVRNNEIMAEAAIEMMVAVGLPRAKVEYIIRKTDEMKPLEGNNPDINGKAESGEQIQSSVGITKKQMTIDAPEVIPKKQDKRLAEDLLEAYRACEEELKNADFKE